MPNSAEVGNPLRDIPHMATQYRNLVVLCLIVQKWVTHLGIFPHGHPIPQPSCAMPNSAEVGNPLIGIFPTWPSITTT